MVGWGAAGGGSGSAVLHQVDAELRDLRGAVVAPSVAYVEAPGAAVVGRGVQPSSLAAHRGHRAVVQLLREAGAPVRPGHEEIAKPYVDRRIGLARVDEAHDAAVGLYQPAVGPSVGKLAQRALDLVQGVLVRQGPRGRGVEGAVAAKTVGQEVEQTGNVRRFGCACGRATPPGGRRTGSSPATSRARPRRRPRSGSRRRAWRRSRRRPCRRPTLHATPRAGHCRRPA